MKEDVWKCTGGDSIGCREPYDRWRRVCISRHCNETSPRRKEQRRFCDYSKAHYFRPASSGLTSNRGTRPTISQGHRLSDCGRQIHTVVVNGIMVVLNVAVKHADGFTRKFFRWREAKDNNSGKKLRHGAGLS